VARAGCSCLWRPTSLSLPEESSAACDFGVESGLELNAALLAGNRRFLEGGFERLTLDNFGLGMADGFQFDARFELSQADSLTLTLAFLPHAQASPLPMSAGHARPDALGFLFLPLSDWSR